MSPRRVPERISRWLSLLISFGVVFVLPVAAHAAAPGGEPLVKFADGVLEFLTGTLGPIVFMIGLAIAAVSLVFGSRDGLQKAIWAVIGGALLYSVDAIQSFVAANT